MTDYFSEGPVSSESISIASPTPGTYYFAFALWTRNATASFRLELTLSGTGSTSPTTPTNPSPTPGTGSSCVTQMTPQATTISSAGGLASFDVQTTGVCTWRAIANQPWVQIITAMPAIGQQTVFFQVPALSGSTRTATITIEGTGFAHQIIQSGSGANRKASIGYREKGKPSEELRVDESPAIPSFRVQPQTGIE